MLLRRIRGRATARPVKIFLYPRMVQSQEFRNRSDRDDLPIREHRDPVADGVERVEVVGDQEDGEVEPLLEPQDQFVERGRGDRVEPGRRLVEEQQLRIERQRPRQPGALAPCRPTAPTDIWARRRAGARPSRSCSDAISSSSGGLMYGKYSRIGTSTFSATVSVENKAPFWNRMPQRRRMFLASSSSRPIIFSPSTSISPSAGVCRPMIERISTDLPVPEPPTTPRISPRQTSRSRSSWMTCSPKRLASPRTVMIGWDVAHSQPTELKKTANTASRTITRKIDWTTAVVVRRPTSSRIALDQHALEAAGQRDDEAEHRRLDQADPQIGERDDFLQSLDVGQRRNAERRARRRCRRRAAT